MSSAVEQPRSPRDIVETDEERIQVEHLPNGVVSIRYRGRNPDTRYLPPEPTAWEQIRESFRLGWSRA
jgi:hypothetical protein